MSSAASVSGRKFIGTRAVAARYNVTTRSIERWMIVRAFPEPHCRIRGRRYWDEAELDKLDRSRVVEHAAAAKAKAAAAPGREDQTPAS
jgi:hypothetical protein